MATRKQNFATAIEIISNSADERKDEIIAALDHEIALLDKKTANKAPTAKQKENEKLKVEILNALTATGAPATVGEIMMATGLTSNQKVSALLTQLKNAGKVVRTVDKKVAYFSAA